MRSSLLLACALVSCSEVTHVVWSRPPAVAGARSMIVVLSDRDGPSRFAFELDVEGGLPDRAIALIAVEGDAALRLDAFYYAHSLTELGIAAGEIGDPTDCLFTEPLAIVESTGGDWSAVERDRLALLVEADACELTSKCHLFRVSTIPLEDQSYVRLALTLDDQRALIATEAGSFFEVSADRAVRRRDLVDLPSLAAIVDRQGELWLGGEGGRVVRGSLGGAMEEVRRGPAGEVMVAFGESAAGRMLGVAMNARTSTATEVRIYELAPEVRLLAELPVIDPSPELTQIAWLPDRALAVINDYDALVVEGDIVRKTRPSETTALGEISFAAVTAVADTAYLGGSAGYLYRSHDLEDWFLVDVTRLGTKLRAILSFEGGLIYISEDGVVGQHYPLRALCMPQGLISIDPTKLLAVGSRLLVAGTGRNGPNQLLWLDP